MIFLLLQVLLEKKITGKLFGDKGYLSQQLFEEMLNRGVQLITKLRSNMKNRLMRQFCEKPPIDLACKTFHLVFYSALALN